jgi:hypothetical protein
MPYPGHAKKTYLCVALVLETLARSFFSFSLFVGVTAANTSAAIPPAAPDSISEPDLYLFHKPLSFYRHTPLRFPFLAFPPLTACIL